MSETLSHQQDSGPDTLGGVGAQGVYTTLTSASVNYPSQPTTPSSTVQDVPNHSSLSNLPPFSTFSNDMDAGNVAGVGGSGFGDTRLLDISNWDYYGEGLTGRLLERTEHGLSIITSQPQYRPWESKPIDSTSQDALRNSFAANTPINSFADAFATSNSKLPSFQSQFQSFNEAGVVSATDAPSLTTLTNLTPVSPSSSSPGSQNLTQLNPPNFHTLSTVNPRNYPLVPAPIQAREIPSIQQQFLDERHIQLYSHPTTNLTTLNNAIHTTNLHFPGQNGTIIQNNQLIQGPTVVTVIKTEPSNFVDLKLGASLTTMPTTLGQPEITKLQHVGGMAGVPLHPTQFQNPMGLIDNSGMYNGLDKKINGFNGLQAVNSPTRNDFRKKERRKIRASSLESSATESDGANSNMDVGGGCENSGQVAAISSTAGFKSPHTNMSANNGMEVDEISGGGDKQVKKKRKRCGECIGCQRKDNCGDCAPCRNDKSHQICKQRRCEKLTEKKNLYAPDGSLLRGESRRGRGKGRGNYRGRKPAGANNSAIVTTSSGGGQQSGSSQGGISLPEASPQSQSAPTPVVPSARPSPPNSHLHTQQVMLKPADQATVPPTHQPMTPMPFYPDPNRFPTPVWQADPSQAWPQGQFIQQIPAQPGLEYHTQQYANPPTIYQTNYQQTPTGFEPTNTFYASPVQVLTNQRPPSASSHASLTPRANGNYAHTPSPSPIGQGPNTTPNGVHRNAQMQQSQYNTEYISNNSNFQTTPSPSIDGQVSRPSSVSSNNTSGNFQNSNNNSQSSVQPNFTGNNINVATSNSYTPQTVTSPATFSPNSSNSNNQYQNTNGQNNTGQNNFQSSQNFQSNNQSNFQSVRNNGSGNAQPGYPPVNSNPQLVSHNSSGGYPGSQYISGDNNNVLTQQNTSPSKERHQSASWQQSSEQNPDWAQNWDQNQHANADQFSQSERVNLNSRIKTMILNKQQMNMGEKMNQESEKEGNVSTGHFLLHSHHRRSNNEIIDGGGVSTWTNQVQPPTSAIDTFMKFATNENNFQTEHTHPKTKPEHLNEIRNFQPDPDKSKSENPHVKSWNFEGEDSKAFQNRMTFGPVASAESQNNQEMKYPAEIKQEVPLNSNQYFGQTQQYPYESFNSRQDLYAPTNYPEVRKINEPFYQSQEKNSYAYEKPENPYIKTEHYPFGTNRNFDEKTSNPYQNYNESPSVYMNPQNYQNYDKATNPEKTDDKLPEQEVQTKETNNNKENEEEKEKAPSPKAETKTKTTPAHLFAGDGGPMSIKKQGGSWCCRQGGTENPTAEHLRDGACMGLQTQDEILADPNEAGNNKKGSSGNGNNNNNGTGEAGNKGANGQGEIKPNDCNCFTADKSPPEPGSYYTHLGTASTLAELRKDLETRTGIKGKGVRIEKVCYTGKEGKTTQGCPLAKWIIRRTSIEEKILAIVKHRQGHCCKTAYIVVCIVAWDGIPTQEADRAYNLLTHKLNRYGLPTTRRCATNEPRTCACQGLDPDTCGASFSFGCSWSMYYNGCKYARSKTVRKFRLSVKTEENEIEERMHVLATLLSPLYLNLAPEAFKNQCLYEREASECRLGFKPGRPFSGVTACIDFCAHSHRDLHNMNNGCTVVVSLTKHRSFSKPSEEQLHVLPLYIMDETDENGSKEGQQEKIKNGSLEALTKYPCEVRVRSVPLQPCRRHGKKRKEDEPDAVIKTPKEPPNVSRSSTSTNTTFSNAARSPRSQTPGSNHQNHPTGTAAPLLDMVSMLDNFTDAQLQSSQVSSTVLDSPTMYPNWTYDNSGLYTSQNQYPNPMHPHSVQTQNPYAPSQYPPPGSNAAWLESQSKRQNMFYNSWESYGYGNAYKEIKEDPDSTTMSNTNTESDSGIGSSNNSTRSLNNSNLSLDDSSISEKNSSLKSLSAMDPFMSMNDSELKEVNSLKMPQHPKSGSSPQSTSNTNQNKNSQGFNSGVMPSCSTPQTNEMWHHQPQNFLNGNKPPGWDSSQTEISPFRIPKGRPPSRSQNNPSMSPDSNLSSNSTFLKPYPPNERNSTHIANQENPYKYPTPDHVQPPSRMPEVPHYPPNTNWHASEDIKQTFPDYHSGGNPYTATYPNPISGYSNFPGHFTTPYTHPYNPYEGNHLNYPNLDYANSIKREEYLRNTACYNPYSGYQNYPPANWNPPPPPPPPNWCQNSPAPAPPNPWFSYPAFGIPPYVPEQPKSEPIGEITDFTDNEECFKDSQMGGVAIALGHGSVLFECAKHEMHATTALRKPNRLSPTRISLVFYQHRNLNRPKHGLEEWEQKMRLRKLGITTTGGNSGTTNTQTQSSGDKEKDALQDDANELAALVEATSSGNKNSKQVLMRAPTLTTMSWTTLFPMHPCVVTGPYQENGAVG